MKGQWYVLAAAVLWGTTGTAQALAPAQTNPLALGAVRLAVGGSALMLLALPRGVFKGSGRWPVKSTALAAVSMAAYQVFFFTALLRTGVATGTIVAIGSAPVLTGALGILFQSESPRPRWLLATILAIIGCMLLVAAAGDIRVEVVGIASALAAGGSYAVYAVISKKLLDSYSPDAVIAVVFFLAAILLLPLTLVADLNWLWQPRGLVVAAHLGLVATAGAYALFARGLSMIPSATAVSLSLAEPLTAGALGIVLLGERMTIFSAIGVGLIFVGLALLTVGGPGFAGRSVIAQGPID